MCPTSSQTLFKSILLIMLLQLSHYFSPLYSPPPCTLPPSNIPPLSSCPWIIHVSSLASPFPILFITIPIYFFKDFIYLFLERGEGRGKKREGNIIVWLPLMLPLLGTWPATQACALTGNRTGNTLACRPFSKYFQVNYRGHHISFPAILG